MSLPFNLRFSLSEIEHWADQYRYEDDTHIEQVIGPRSKAQGFFTRDDFVELCGWKSKRPRKFCLLNNESEVKSATSIALGTLDERLRMDSLRSLHGVEMRTASALLHFAGRDRYPILDVRALWSLNISEAPSYYGFNLWWSYTEFCRQLADEAHVTMRILDRALWQFSDSNQKNKTFCCL